MNDKAKPFLESKVKSHHEFIVGDYIRMWQTKDVIYSTPNSTERWTTVPNGQCIQNDYEIDDIDYDTGVLTLTVLERSHWSEALNTYKRTDKTVTRTFVAESNPETGFYVGAIIEYDSPARHRKAVLEKREALKAVANVGEITAQETRRL